MALFSRKPKPSSALATEGKEEKKETKAVVAAPARASASSGQVPAGLAHVLKHARITEKATMQQGGSVYTFDISEGATKREIIAAVKSLYKVSPAKVAVVKVPSKLRRSARTGKIGVKKGGRKAYVFLKKGETITVS